MSANAGDAKATLSGDASSFMRSLADSSKELETFSKHMKKLANDFAMVGGAIAVGAIGSLKAVADFNYGAQLSFKNFKDAGLTMANQIAGMVKPAIDHLSTSIRQMADWFAGLPPKTRENIATFVRLAVEVGAAAVVFARLMEVAHGLFGVLTTVSGIIAAIGAGPLALILTGVLALVVGIAVFRKAWQNDWGGIREIVKDVIDTMTGWWTAFADFLSTLWGGIVDDIARKAKALAAVFFMLQGQMPGANKQAIGFAAGAVNTGIDQAAKIAKDPHAVGTLVLDAGRELKSMADDTVADFKKMMKDLAESLGLVSDSSKKARQIHERSNITGQEASSYSDRVMKDIASSLDDFKNARSLSGGTSTARGGNYATPVAMSFEDTVKLFKEQLVESWDQGNWSGVWKSVGDLIVTDLTSLDEIAGAMKVAGNALTSKLGKLGETINAGVQGFQSGGIWGAFAAVIIEFLSNVKGWNTIMNIANGQFQMALNDMSKGLNDVISGLQPLMGAVESIMSAVHQVLGPILSLIGSILKGIAPILEVFGTSLQVVAGTLGPLIQIVGGILDPIFKLLAITLTPLVMLFMALKVAVDYVALGFNMLIEWIDNSFVSAINGIIDFINNIVHAGLNHVGDGMNNDGGVAAAQTQINADTTTLTDFANDFAKNPFDALNNLEQNSANAAAAIGAMGDTANQVSEDLRNVPEGFKIALAAFNATQPVGSSSSPTVHNSRFNYLRTGSTLAGGFPRKKP